MKQEPSSFFCPKCGSLLAPKRGAKKVRFGCVKCNYISKDKGEMKLQEKGGKAEKIKIMDDDPMKAYPKTKEECPKCGNRNAYFWTVQTRAGDEAETRFFECTKCKHRWRAYS